MALPCASLNIILCLVLASSKNALIINSKCRCLNDASCDLRGYLVFSKNALIINSKCRGRNDALCASDVSEEIIL